MDYSEDDRVTTVEVVFWVSCLLVIGGRFLIPGHGLSWAGTYEAVVHIWVGIVLAAWWYTRRRFYLAGLALATLLEVILFALRGSSST